MSRRRSTYYISKREYTCLAREEVSTDHIAMVAWPNGSRP